MKILIVEDDTLTSGMLRDILKAAEHVVACVRTAEDALLMLQHDDYDVMITDILLPGLSGFDLIEKVQKTPEGKSLHFVVTSALDSDGLEYIRKHKDLKLLRKPYTPDQIREALGELAQQAV